MTNADHQKGVREMDFFHTGVGDHLSSDASARLNFLHRTVLDHVYFGAGGGVDELHAVRSSGLCKSARSRDVRRSKLPIWQFAGPKGALLTLLAFIHFTSGRRLACDLCRRFRQRDPARLRHQSRCLARLGTRCAYSTRCRRTGSDVDHSHHSAARSASSIGHGSERLRNRRHCCSLS